MKRILGIAQATNSDLFWGGGNMFIVCPEHGGGTWTLQFRNPAFRFGPGTNVFANDAARNAYFGNGGAALLPIYNNDRTLVIRNGTNTQRRNAGGTAWENYNTLIQWVDTTTTITGAGITAVNLPSDMFFRLNGGTTGAVIYLASSVDIDRPTRGNRAVDDYGEYDERP